MSNSPVQEVDKKPSKRPRKLNQSSTLDAPISVSKRTRGRRGALKNFAEMPLDILFEVCSEEGMTDDDVIHADALDLGTPSSIRPSSSGSNDKGAKIYFDEPDLNDCLETSSI